MNIAGTVCADSREEVLRFEAMSDVFELLAVARKEDRSRPWTIANADHIALFVDRCIVGAKEWLVVSSLAVRCVCNGEFVPP